MNTLECELARAVRDVEAASISVVGWALLGNVKEYQVALIVHRAAWARYDTVYEQLRRATKEHFANENLHKL